MKPNTQDGAEPAAMKMSPAAFVCNWWPVLLAPLTVVGIYAADALGWGNIIAKGPNEILAPVLLAAAAAICAARWAFGARRRVHLVLAVLAATLLCRETCREIGVPWMRSGVFGVAALIGVWGVAWRKSLAPKLLHKTKGRWLVVTGWSYFLALLIQRRAMRFLPDESRLHVQIEEVLENLAHLLYIVTSLL